MSDREQQVYSVGEQEAEQEAKKTPKKTFSYSNIELGKLSMVNIQNPFKIILFYADFNTAILLDNNLNELTQKLDFTKVEIEDSNLSLP